MTPIRHFMGSTQRPKQSWPFFAKFGKSNFARNRIHFGLLVDPLRSKMALPNPLFVVWWSGIELFQLMPEIKKIVRSCTVKVWKMIMYNKMAHVPENV